MLDVAVIGAGPSGLHAARLLSARGLDVIVLEEHEVVWSSRALHWASGRRSAFDEFDLPEDTILNPLRTRTVRLPGGTGVRLSS